MPIDKNAGIIIIAIDITNIIPIGNNNLVPASSPFFLANAFLSS